MSYKGPERRRGEKLRYIGVQAILGLLCVLVLTSLYGAFVDAPQQRAEISETVERLDDEREARVDSAAAIILLGCVTDNNQDRLLANLVEVSLSGSTFGGGIDPADLTPYQLEVVTAIAAVQEAAARAPETEQAKVFEQALEDLQSRVPCRRIVRQYRSGEPVPIPAELEREP